MRPATVVGLVVASVLGTSMILVRMLSDDRTDTAAPTTTTTMAPTTTIVSETTTIVPATTATVPPRPSPIPGLAASTVHGTLVSQGFFCGPSAEQPLEAYVISVCIHTRAISLGSVETYDTPDDEVVFVEVGALEQEGFPYLELVAGLISDDARLWVQRSGLVTGGRSGTTIDGISYEMTSVEDPVLPTWKLRIGVEPDTSP